LPRRIAIIGTGLIGGSIGIGLRAADPDVYVVGYDRDADAAARAKARGAVDEAATSPRQAVTGADVVVLSVPVDRIPAACRTVAGAAGPGAVVTDVGSAKARAVDGGEGAFGGRFVGGHPMAGSERHGIDAADGRLFEDAWWILTPTARTSSDAYSEVTAMVGGLGARPVAVRPSVHDALVARLSHLPQLAASALVEVAAGAGDRDALLGLAAGGFRDVTRVAASHPDLWVAILRSNRSAVLEALEGMRGTLGEVAGLVAADRWDELREWLDRTRRARLELFAKPHHQGEPVALSMLVPDRPGVLAEVTTAAGNLGVNVEDIRIVHSTEGGRGRLELVVSGQPRADELGAALHDLGYRVEKSHLDVHSSTT
jgi:prephenate dehydrogenase